MVLIQSQSPKTCEANRTAAVEQRRQTREARASDHLPDVPAQLSILPENLTNTLSSSAICSPTDRFSLHNPSMTEVVLVISQRTNTCVRARVCVCVCVCLCVCAGLASRGATGMGTLMLQRCQCCSPYQFYVLFKRHGSK